MILPMVKRCGLASIKNAHSREVEGGWHPASIYRANGRDSAAVIQDGRDLVLGRGIAEITEREAGAGRAATYSLDAGMVQPGGTTGPRSGGRVTAR